jgi:endonuclease/exonuclease/phosphatase (EEP) superfamily protein YafD
MVVRSLLAVALAVGAGMTLGGMLAPVYPAADFLNHFRPYTLAGIGALLAVAMTLHARWTVVPVAVLVALNAVLLALPLVWSADPAERHTVGQALASEGGRDLKLVTFNTFGGAVEPIARFLLAENPDIAVLQEIAPQQATALAALLRASYPHAHACRPQDRCHAAILARRAWVETGHAAWTNANPETIWVQFDDPDLGRFRVVGVHLHLPYRSEQQTRQIERLIALRASFDGPAIVAGDFNMTPWSYRLQHLLASAGLRRHATFLRSWPTDLHPWVHLPAPAFLIDHVLSTPDIASVSIRTGPKVGSDHLPVVAVVRLPRADHAAGGGAFSAR